MKTGKILLGVILLLSLSFNVAFVIFLLTHNVSSTQTPPSSQAPTTSPTPPQENQLQINLSSEQQKQIEPIRTKIHNDNDAIKKQIQQCQEKLLNALKTEPPDKQAIYRCIDNINNLQKKIQENTIEEIILIRKIMDPDQCHCLMENLGAAMQQTTRSCNCPSCQSHKKE